MIKPTDSTNNNKNAEQTAKDSVCFLATHGFLSKKESEKCEAKIAKWEKEFYRATN